jgi:hypothetical protein
MKRLPPSGYVTADESKKPGYLAKRMAIYRAKVEEQKKKDDAVKAELAKKVARIK